MLLKLMLYKKLLPSFLINFVKNNYFFWKYRHFINKNIWEGYLEDFNSKRRDVYFKVIKDNNYISVFEFGCASGPNIKNILLKNPNLLALGFDINKDAISLAKKEFKNFKANFTTKCNEKIILENLNNHNIKCFDLGIYDRVLYLLNEDDVESHFKMMNKYLRSVIIDDFFSENTEISESNYKTKNFIKILQSCNYKLIKLEDSKHEKRNNFFKKNAKILFFENNFNLNI